jgi:hypothetical protein
MAEKICAFGWKEFAESTAAWNPSLEVSWAKAIASIVATRCVGRGAKG